MVKKKKEKKKRWSFYPLYARMFKCIGIPMKAHCGPKFATHIQTHHSQLNTMPSTCTLTHTVHMSCVQFRFYIRSVRCFIFQLLVRFASFWLFCVYSDYTTHIRLVCAATESQLAFHSHHNIVCTSIARCNYKQNTYDRTYVARECKYSIVNCCIAYITHTILLGRLRIGEETELALEFRKFTQKPTVFD